MRLFFTLLFVSIFNFLYADDIDIIELHENKTLDQLVLETDSGNNEIQANNNEDDDSKESFEKELNIEEESNIIEEESNIEEENPLIENEEIIIDVSNFWEAVDPSRLSIYFRNINSINSPTLYNEFVKLLTDFNLDINNSKNKEILFLIIKKLIGLGEIQKAYNLIQSIQLPNDENLIFYKTLKLNYLFSTYQLNEACELKNDFNSQEIKLSNYYLEKADIFCLVMEEKIDEANLLNSILLETEINDDQYFQDLLNILINHKNDGEKVSLTLTEGYFEDLIFLYSAMLRIAELPLTEKFLQIDPNNLSIPIILSNATDLELRLKAANKAYLNNLISIESLAALYQSVDFNSDQLNNPTTTLEKLKDKNELIMAYFFQVMNIQIFPSSRIGVILDFWKFAELNNLEKISFHLTYNIISSIEPSADRANIGPQLATAFIYNNNYQKALKWIILTQNSDLSNENLENVKLLYDVYRSEDTQKILNYITDNYDNLINSESTITKEILLVALNVLDSDNNYNSNLFFEKVMDERQMPTIFLNSEIEQAIKNKDESNLFLLILVSLNNKEWIEIHPEHLKLVLKGIKNYKNSELLKNTLLNIFENNKIF